MPLNSAIVGASGELTQSEVDARWTMAYAAALGDLQDCYLNTLGQVVAHPLFPVCFEWPVIVAMRDVGRSGLTLDEVRRGVHATHDLIIHRPIRPPERLRTRATVAAVEGRKPGAYQVTKVATIDERGELVCESWYGSIARGVAVDGDNRFSEQVPEPPVPHRQPNAPAREAAIQIEGGLAHTYTECARIFNPIHTDAAVAKGAGLPAIILHGTATLALAISNIVANEANGNPKGVRRVGGRFSAMVMMPSQVQLQILSRERDAAGDIVFFRVLNAEGTPAIRDGYVVLSNHNGEGR